MQALIRGEVDALATREEAGAKGGRGNKAVDNVNSFGGSQATYTLKRLKRDHPALFAKVVAGDLRSQR